MRRGFKTEAERIANELRETLGCGPDDAIPLDQLAVRLGVELISGDTLVPIEQFEALNEIQEDAFSAASFPLPGSRKVIVHNPLHAEGRTRSNQAHELAHVILDHNLRTIERVGSLRFVTCDPEQEEEADWLGGCLLLPRAILLKAAKAGFDPVEIARRYRTSEPMARFRLNASGVLVQLGRQRAAKQRRVKS